MMAKNSDYENNLLNQLAYVDFNEDTEPGCNLITALENSGAGDLAESLQKAGYGDYVLKDYENNNKTNGFVAVAIENPSTGDVGISFRGTEKLPEMGQAIASAIGGDAEDVRNAINNQIDMIDNISSAVTGDSAQVQEAQDFFQRNQSDTGNNYLYGHSKGGNLALEVYVENYDEIEQVHVINAQPVNWATLDSDQRSALKNGKIDATVINGDLVWMLGGVPYPVRVIKNTGEGDGLFDPHELQSAYYNPNTGEAQKEYFPYLSYPIQGLLGIGANGLITIVQAGYEVGDTFGEWIDAAHHFFTEEIPEHAQRLWDSVNDAWQKTKEFSLDVIDNVGDFFTDVLEDTRDWWSDLFGKNDGGGNGAKSGSPCRIRVDTDYLQQLASRIGGISREIEDLEGSIHRCARSLEDFRFAGSVALQASLWNGRRKVRDLGRSAGALSVTLTDIAEAYDQAEQNARSSAST